MSNSGLLVIPVSELRHKARLRHIESSGTQDGFGHYQQVTADYTDRCHIEFDVFHDESERVKNKEFVLRYDLMLILLPSSKIRQGDQIMWVKAHNGEVVFQDDGGSNPMTVHRLRKITADEGVHHIEAYCNFHHPQINAG